jgi:hypothetical protein
MEEYPAFKVRKTPWRASSDGTRFSLSAYYESLDSLSDWLGRNSKFIRTGSKLHMTGELPDIAVSSTGAFGRPEKTIQLTALSIRVVSGDFVDFVQKWLLKDYKHWRIVIPTIDSIDKWITIYPKSVRLGELTEPSSKDYENLVMEMVLEDPKLLDPNSRRKW